MVRRIAGRKLFWFNRELSTLVRSCGYRDLLLAELEKAPATASHLSTKLLLDRGALPVAIGRFKFRFSGPEDDLSMFISRAPVEKT